MGNFRKFVEQKTNKKFDKVQYYYEYYKNLTPKFFKVSKEKDSIIIKIKP